MSYYEIIRTNLGYTILINGNYYKEYKTFTEASQSLALIKAKEIIQVSIPN